MRSILFLSIVALALAACSPRAGTFETYDVNRDRGLTEGELTTGLFNEWDTDDDTLLSEDEFGAGTGSLDTFPGDADFGVFDTDDDRRLTNTEFGVGFDEAGVFDEWDLDRNNILSVDETAEIGLP